MKKWQCKVCGYDHEGENPPQECPLCGVGPEEFVAFEEASATISSIVPSGKRWKCTVCDYIHVGEEPPEHCPLCGVGPELFDLLEDNVQELTADSIATADKGTTRAALEQISYGLYIVSATQEEKLNAQCVNAVFQLTTRPARVAICINKNNLTHDYINETRKFAISVLGSENPEHTEMVKLFGYQSGRKVDKFLEVPYMLGQMGCPILKNCIAYIECQVLPDKIVDVDTHTMFVADVIAGRVLSNEKPLTYAAYRDTKHK